MHLLSGIALCGVCGNICGSVSRTTVGQGRPDASGEQKVQEKYHTYMCQGAPGKGGFHTAIKCEFLDHIVVEAVVSGSRCLMP